MPTTAEPPFRTSRYTTGAILLHWTIALAILLQLASGYAMAEILREGSATQFDVYQVHKSLGVMVLILTVARILWRLFNPPPPEPASVNAMERRISGIVHGAFYALLLVIPLAGWLMITVAPVQIETVLFFAKWLPWPHIPGLGGLTEGAKGALYEGSKVVHMWLAYAMGGLVLLHVAGALKHHFADGGFIARMSPFARGDGPRNSYGHATTTIVTLLVFGGLVGSAAYARYGGEIAGAQAARESGVSPDQADILASAPPAQPLAAATPAAAEPAAAPGTTQAPEWQLDAEASTLGYAITFNGGTVEGGFERFDARILFAPEDLAGSSVEVSVDTRSAFIDSSEISLTNLAGADGFDNANHGTARFVSETIRQDGEGYVAEGTLSIKGESVAQSLPFTIDIEGDRATAQGSLTLDRFAYAIGTQNDASGETIGPEVTVSFSVAATRVASSPAPAQQDAATLDLWEVFKDESRLAYSFVYEGSEVAGTLPSFDAQIRFDADNLAASSIGASVELSDLTVTAGSVPADQIGGVDGLAISTQPVARFQSERIEADGNGGFLATGALSVRGESNEASLPFTLSTEGDRTVATGTLAIDTEAFGFGADAGFANALSPTVDVELVISARPPAAQAASR